MPGADTGLRGAATAAIADRLSNGQGDSRRVVGGVFTQHQNGVVGFDVGQARDVQGAVQRLHNHLVDGLIACAHAIGKVLRPHQLAQRRIGLQAGPWRADAHHRAGQHRPGPGQRGAERRGIVSAGAVANAGLGYALFGIDEMRAIAAAIAQKVTIDRKVIAIVDPP